MEQGEVWYSNIFLFHQQLDSLKQKKNMTKIQPLKCYKLSNIWSTGTKYKVSFGVKRKHMNIIEILNITVQRLTEEDQGII